MSDTNLKITQDVYAAFGRGDIPAMLDEMAEEVTFGLDSRKEDGVPMFGIRFGKAGAADFFRDVARTHTITMFEPTKFLAAQDKVFVWGTVAWTMCSNGVSGQNDWLHELTYRDGKLLSWRGHIDTAYMMTAYNAPAAKRSANG